MTTLFYIHGYGSSSTGDSAIMFRDMAPDYGFDFYGFDYSVDDLSDPLKIHNNIVDKINQLGDVIVVGSSLGGYFANLAALATDSPMVLINPSIHPEIALKKYSIPRDILCKFYDMPQYHNHVPRVIFCGIHDTTVLPETNGHTLRGDRINIDMGHRVSAYMMPTIMERLSKLNNNVIDTDTDFK